MASKSCRSWAAACVASLVLAGCSANTEEKRIASARAFLSKGQTSAAIIELKNALGLNARSAEARQLLGKALLESGDPAAAEVELRKATEAGARDDDVLPSLARAMLVLGQPAKVIAQFGEKTLGDPSALADLKTWVASAYAQQGDQAKANEVLAAALRAQPQHAPALMAQARLKAATGDVDGALALLDAVLQKDPENEHAGVAKGYLLWLGKQDGAAALQMHRKVLAAHPNSVPAQAEIVTFLLRDSKYGEARQQFAQLKKTAPSHPETIFFEGQFAYLDKQYRQAREYMDALLKLAPDHLRALELAAAAEYHLGNDAQVESFVGRALKVAPGLILSRQILAQSYLRSGQPAQAIQVLQPVTEGAAPDPESLALAGSAYLQAGDAKRADEAFKLAAGLAPNNPKVRAETAFGLIGGGRADEGLRELTSLAKIDPGPRADIALVSALIAQGDLRGALKATEALGPKMPGHPLPDQLRGQVLVALHDADGARRSFEAAFAKNSKYFPAVAALAAMEVATGKPDAARQRVAAFVKSSPNSSQAMLLLADIPSAGGAPAADALQQLANAVRANPADPRTHLALISRQLQYADKDSALTAAQAATAALPNDLSILEALGQTQLIAGKVQQAVSTFRKLTALLPASAAAQMNLAEACVAATDFDMASRAMRRALELDPRRGDAHRGLAMLALRDKRIADALRIAHEMQQLDPKGALGYATEGDIEAKRKNWPAAVAAFQSALRYSDASEAAIKLHVVLGASKQAAEADRLVADWERRRPSDPAFRFYLGDVAMNQQKFPEAEVHYRAVLVNQPRNALAMNNIAWLLHKQSKPGGLAMVEQANALMPHRAPILDTLALILAATGKVSEAVKAQRQAIAAAPQDPTLKLALARYLIQDGKTSEARAQLKALAELGDNYTGQPEVQKLLKSI